MLSLLHLDVRTHKGTDLFLNHSSQGMMVGFDIITVFSSAASLSRPCKRCGRSFGAGHTGNRIPEGPLSGMVIPAQSGNEEIYMYSKYSSSKAILLKKLFQVQPPGGHFLA